MPLSVIATPIGNNDDISLRSLEALKNCDLLITEERKVGARLMRALEIKIPEFEQLNEHTTDEELSHLLGICKERNVALISDCGTPGFCDPGANLVNLCRKNNVPVAVMPGPSSLMAFLSGSGHRIDRYYFYGFLPANTEKRQETLKSLKGFKDCLIFMDTPYRLKKTLQNMADTFPKRTCVLGLSLTQENEVFLEGSAAEVLKKLPVEKAEFVLAILT